MRLVARGLPRLYFAKRSGWWGWQVWWCYLGASDHIEYFASTVTHRKLLNAMREADALHRAYQDGRHQ